MVELEIEVVEDEGSGVGGFIGFNNLRKIWLLRISSRLDLFLISCKFK